MGKQLNMASIITSAGPDAVPITKDSVEKTIAGATFKGQGNDLVLDTSSFYKPTQSGAYPIVLATYEIVCSKYPDAATGKAVKAFMQAAIGPGQEGWTSTVPSRCPARSRRSCRARSMRFRDMETRR